MSIRSRELTTDTALNVLLEDFMLTKRTALPGIIKKVTLKNNALVSVDVQPVIQQFVASEDGQSNTTQSLPIIPGVPVVFPYAQKLGLSLTLPIAIGDDCLLVFADRSIDLWQENGGIQAPIESTTPRTHDLTDAICIPGIINNITAIADYKTDAIEIRNKDRSFYIRLNDTIIEYKTTNATFTMDASSITLNAPTITIEGTTLNLNSTETKMGGSLIDKNGVVLEDHIHIDSEGGMTSPPQN